MPPRFLIRSARLSDLADVSRLAKHLDSYNLPADRVRLRRLLADSVLSFSGRQKELARRRYLFVLEDAHSHHVLGTSLIIAKHGTPGLPHLYMTNFIETRTSRTLKRTVRHKCLRLGFTEDGPTEVGGLVVLPSHRGGPERLGHALSYIRFLFMAAHLEDFQRFVLVEFLPTFLKKGRSPFWEYFGKKFTGLSYRKADRLSIDNKEFVLSLFPQGNIYQDFFPKSVVDYLGEIGNPTKPAARILQKIGFRYLQQIEPFDGGPYYGALLRSVRIVQKAKQVQGVRKLNEETADHPGRVTKKNFLIMTDGGKEINAVVASARVLGVRAELEAETFSSLAAREGDWLWVCPFP